LRIVIIVVIPIAYFWLLLVIYSAERTSFAIFSLKILQKFVAREKAERLIIATNNAITDVCKMSRENFNSRSTKVSTGIAITVSLFQELSLWFFAGGRILAYLIH